MSAPSNSSKNADKPGPSTDREIRGLRLQRGGIMSGPDLIHNFRMDPAKLREWNSWEENGLYPIDTGTQTEYYSSDEVIDFMLSLPRIKKPPRNPQK